MNLAPLCSDIAQGGPFAYLNITFRVYAFDIEAVEKPLAGNKPIISVINNHPAFV